jgi:Kef-type K+ transport system membrane component KefB
MSPLELAVILFSAALIASALSVRLGITVALLELLLGVVVGNILNLNTTDWLDFLARFGAVLLTFLAGLEVDTGFLRSRFKQTATLGALSFLGPLVVVSAVTLLLFNWGLRAALISGISLSTASLAIIYSQLVDKGLTKVSFGKLVMSSAFITDLLAVVALTVALTRPTIWFPLYVTVSLLLLVTLPRAAQWFYEHFGKRTFEAEVKLIFLCLLVLMLLATLSNGRAVLSAFLLGSVMSGYYVRHKDELNKLRTVAFSFLTPLFFIKSGMLVSLGAVYAHLPILAVLVLCQLPANLLLTYPAARRINRPNATIISFMLAPGLSIGLIAAVYGLTNNIIDNSQFSVLVSTIIITAIIPTAIVEKKLLPRLMRQRVKENQIDSI